MQSSAPIGSVGTVRPIVRGYSVGLNGRPAGRRPQRCGAGGLWHGSLASVPQRRKGGGLECLEAVGTARRWRPVLRPHSKLWQIVYCAIAHRSLVRMHSYS